MHDSLAQAAHTLRRLSRVLHDNLPSGRLGETEAQLIKIRQRELRRTLEVDAHQQPLQIEAEVDILERPRSNHGHGAALVLAGVAAGADPLEERLLAVNLDVEEIARHGVHRLLA